MNLTILEPMSDPMIHKGVSGALTDLKEYAIGNLRRKRPLGRRTSTIQRTRAGNTPYHGRLEAYGRVARAQGRKIGRPVFSK